MGTTSHPYQQRFAELLQPYAQHSEAQRMKQFVQHGSVSTYQHCVRVSWTAFRLAKKLHVTVNEEDLVAGCFLHDFYLYDWHDRSTSQPKHATKHPIYARENAVRVFDVNPRVQGIIESHMWPLPPTRVPRCREAWLLCAADKWCSLLETLKR